MELNIQHHVAEQNVPNVYILLVLCYTHLYFVVLCYTHVHYALKLYTFTVKFSSAW